MPLQTDFAATSRVDSDVVSRFARSCRALGLSVHDRRRPPDLPAARSGFAELTRIAREQCDAWTGLGAAGGDTSRHASSKASGRTVKTAWRVAASRSSLATGDLTFSYETGLYLQFRRDGPDDFALASAGHPLRRPATTWPRTRSWGSTHHPPAALARGAVGPGGMYYRPSAGRTWCDCSPRWSTTRRWTRRMRMPCAVALGTALARLGMFAPALSYLEEPAGPVDVAAVDGTLVKALSLRAQGEDLDGRRRARRALRRQPRERRGRDAISDTSFGIVPTTAARIEARSDPWDPETEPTETDFVDPGAKERKAHLLIEAEAELAEFIGLEEVKYQVARLKSSVAMAIRRQDRGLTVAHRTNHLVFAGPPGTGKTTIARVVAKIYCGLGILKKETVREVHRADLIGQHIGETEAKTNGIIDSALDGVLFLDEAYALVSTGAKNDFGLVAIDTLLARMENDRDRLVVIVAGYRKDLDAFLDTNEGLRSRFTRSIDFPSYSPHELVGDRDARWPRSETASSSPPPSTIWSRCSLSSPPQPLPMPTVSQRRSLDIAGNGRFVRNLVERSEEEREYRLDHSDTEEFTDDELMTITDDDVSELRHPVAARPRSDGAAMSDPDNQDRREFTSRTPVNENPDRVVYRRGFVTRHQVSGWRFIMRRIASGVALHDTRMLVDPLRTQSAQFSSAPWCSSPGCRLLRLLADPARRGGG